MNKLALSLGTLCILGMNVTPVEATVTTVAQYRLGEADPGAVPGATGANPTLPSVGAVTLSRQGTPSYSATLPTGISSGLSMSFNGVNQRYLGPTVSTLADNFGVEAWVKSNGSTANLATLVYNGNSSSSGWGLFRRFGNWTFLYGGVTFGAGAAPVTTNWTHLALVRSGGVASFYVNGQVNDSATVAPNAPAGGFGIGGNSLAAFDLEYFDGLIDEVRVFTFQPGQFSVTDLNLPPPPQPIPSTDLWAKLWLTLATLLTAGLALRLRRG